MQHVLVVAGSATVISLLIIAYAFAVKSDFGTHTSHTQLGGPLHIEDESIVTGGDARSDSNLIINNKFLDPNSHCDHCNRIQYNKGSQGWAGVAFKNDKLDLTGFKRIVFFARGQTGGELVSFWAIGRDIEDVNPDNNIFNTKNFAIRSTNVSLTNSWKRYEINTYGFDLKDIIYPFGFVVFRNQTQGDLTFFLKGVTFDEDAPGHPIATLKN